MQRLHRSSMADLVGYLENDQGTLERVGEVRITNCAAHTLSAAVAEMLATQHLNTRARGDRTFHLIVSFQAGEQPTPEQLRTIEERICQSLGFAEHQRVSVVHHDTDNVHMHVAINKIHPTRHTMHEPYLAYRTLAKVCARLERELGLRVDKHIPRRTVSEGRAGDMEQHAGVESLMTWVRRECLGALQRADSWAAVHEVLQAHGLHMSQRGAGLVIEAQDSTRVKASTVDRGLSKAAMEARLGAFQAAAGASATQAKPRRTYAKRPTRSRVDTAALFARYEREREGQAEARTAELAAAKRAKDRAVEGARRLYRLHTATLRVVDGRGIDKRLLHAQASRQLKARLQGIHEDHARERARILERHQRMSWADWLKAEALRGDQDALAALRARAAAENLRGATVHGQGGAAAGAGQGPEIDTVTKAGTVLYRAGASAVRDDGQRLQVSREADQEAIRTALRLARQQYGDRISVNGSAAFRAAVVRAAVDMNLPIAFTDPGLERHRQALMQKERPDATSPQSQTGRAAAQRGPGGLHGLRPGAAAAGHASGPVRAKPNPGRHPYQPPPAPGHGLRNLSAVDVDVQREGRRAVLLPGDVRGDLEHQGTAPPDALRRAVHRSGRGQGREVGQAPPPVARKRTSSSSAARRPPAGKGQPPQARAARAQQAPQPGNGKVFVAAVGTKPPPAARARVRPFSALDAGPLGWGHPLRQAAPAPAPAASWQIPGAIFTPAAYAAADAYIAEREGKRALGLAVPRHSRFSPGAGPLTFAGTRNKYGQSLALLKRGDEVLVMPIHATTAQRLTRTGLGTPVKVNANATISTGAGRGHSR
ncbi:relaxase/mobilization nuclease domain-containing protein [Azohydromonas sp. G-1-1-14]|uniref:Relaxase/mobilization nuclease domain-containing protein n=2 Tax=Azohydromonas caseinilytica TaxID=2728836 RepID=A0A848FBW7_9BURK|nr:relaxase/mobilization nuclease domain-containing protein [Azohydromonas caseinilytica]